MEFSGTKKEKQILWNMLRNRGDHSHNEKVIAKGKGELILGRRQKKQIKLEDYGPCPGCFQWLKLDITMYKHQKVCPAKTDNERTSSKGELRVQSMYLCGKLQSKASKALINEVFPIMTNDIISKTAQQDPLIICLGNTWMCRNIGNKLKRKYYTSSRMREAARLLLNARDLLDSNLSMSDLLRPENFDYVAKGALITASPGFDDEEDLQAPSTAIRLGYEIKRMLSAKWAEGIKSKDDAAANDSKSFLKLMKFEWSTKVTKLATVTLQVRSFNKEKSLPEPEDIIKIQEKIRNDIKNFDEKDTTPQNFRFAAEVSQARLLLYNKRRSGEIEGIRYIQLYFLFLSFLI